MVASLRGSVGTGTKEDESSTGRVWAAGFHHGTARSRLARVYEPFIYLIFRISFGPRYTADTGVRLCVCARIYIYIYIYIYI